MINKILFLALAFLVLCAPVQSKDKVKQSEELLLRAVEFHGHLGPFLVLGLKAGLFANQTLGREPMKTEAISKPRQLLLNHVLLMECNFQLDVHLEKEIFHLQKEKAC